MYLPTPREGESPFLDGTCVMFAWDSTALGSFKRCPRKYQLEIIEGWRSRADNVHLTFGILYTEALEAYYQLRTQGVEHEEALRNVVEDALAATWISTDNWQEVELVGSAPDYHGSMNFREGHRWEHGPYDSKIGNKNSYNLIRTIIWYLDQFENDPAETVIAEDGTPLVERSFRMALDWGPKASNWAKVKGITEAFTIDVRPYILCGHLDRVVSFLGGTYVMDHKTTKSTIGDYYFDQFEPNNQMSLYTIAAKVIFNTPIKGAIIDGAQVAVGFSRFARGLTYRTQAQLDEWLKDLRYWFDLAERYATDGYWPMNDTACFSCPFNHHDNKICAKDPAVRESFLASGFTKERPWNPLAIRN